MEWKPGMIARSGFQPHHFCGPVVGIVGSNLRIENLFGTHSLQTRSPTIDRAAATSVSVDSLTDEQCVALAKWRLTDGG